MIRRGIKWFWYCIALSIIIVAVIVSIARLAMPQLDELKPRFEAYLSKKSGTIVRIDEVSGVWRAFGPEVSVTGVRFYAPDNKTTLLSLEQLRVSLDIPKTIFQRNTVLRTFELNGISTSLALNANGEFIFPGFSIEQDNEPVSAVSFIRSLLRHNKVSISNVEVNYIRADGDSFLLQLPRLVVRNREGFHQLLGDFVSERGGSASLALELSNYPLSKNDEMNLYVESKNLKLDQLPIPSGAIGVLLHSGEMELKLWSSWRDGSWKESQASFDIANASLVNHRQERKRVEKIAGSLDLRRVDRDRWHIQSQDLTVSVDGETWPSLWLMGEVERQDEGRLQWQMDFGEIELSRLIQEIQFSNVISDEWREKLNAARIETRVPLVQVDFSTQDETLTHWAAAFEFQNLNYQHDSIPVMPQLSGRVLLSDTVGAIRVVAENTRIDFHDLFKEPLSVGGLQLGLNWRRWENDWRVEIPLLQFVNADAALNAKLAIDFPEQGEPVLSADALLENGNGENATFYYPQGVMSESLIHYLESSIKSAQVTSARTLVRGPLKGFPYLNHEGVFYIKADVQEANYFLGEQWPLVENISADLVFDADAMSISVSDGQIASWRVENGAVNLEQMTSASNHLSINATGKGDAGVAKRVLLASPVNGIVEPITRAIQVDGDLNATLSFEIPLKGEEAFRIDGEVGLERNRLVINALQLPLRELTGTVKFNEHGLVAGAVNAELLGGEISAKISGDEFFSKVDFDGDIQLEDLRRWFPFPLAQFLEGVVPLKGTIALPSKTDDALSVQLNSTLRGLAFHLPAPLQKSKEEIKNAHMSFVYRDDVLDAYGSLENMFNVQGRRALAEDWRLEFLFGNATYAGHHPGVSVRGDVAAVNVAEWVEVIGALSSPEQQTNMSSEVETSAVEKAPRIALSIEKANAFDYPVNHIELGGYPTDVGYRLEFKADEFSGDIKTQQNRPIAIAVKDFIYLSAEERGESVDNEAWSRSETQTRWPEMDISCTQCAMGSYVLGNVNAKIRHDDEMEILNLIAEVKDVFTLDIENKWSATSQSSSATGKLSAKNTGQLSELWQMKKVLEESKGDLSFSLSWPGKFSDFMFAHAKGGMKLDIGKGVITETSDGGARVFSLLSLQSLLRRLSLDFSDLFQKGFHFDSMKADFIVENGIARTENALVDGVSANILIKGDTDFVQQTLNQNVVVQPELSSSLPILAGWVISPTTGVLMWVMNKLFIEQAVNVVTGLEYSVTGTWENPEVVEIKRTQKEVQLPESAKE